MRALAIIWITLHISKSCCIFSPVTQCFLEIFSQFLFICAIPHQNLRAWSSVPWQIWLSHLERLCRKKKNEHFQQAIYSEKVIHLEFLPILINNAGKILTEDLKRTISLTHECFLLLNSVATVFEENKNPEPIK